MNNVEVKVTGHSKSARATLHYISYGTYHDNYSVHLNQPHANDNNITKRNYLLAGVNCHASYKKSLKDFNVYLRKKPHNKVQTLNVVLSFGHRLDWRKPEDRYEGYVLARKFVKRAFPNHQAIIALQEDNHGRQAHIHCIINAISMKAPYNTIPGGHSKHWYIRHPHAKYQPVSYGIVHLRHVAQHCVNDINENDRGFTHHLSGVTRANRTNQVDPNIHLNYYQNYVAQNAIEALNDVHNSTKAKLRQTLRPKGILVSFKRPKTRRRRKHSKRHHRSRYKWGGLVFRVDTKNGSIIDFRHDAVKVKNSHRHYIKSSVLARKLPSLSYKNVLHTLNENKVALSRQHQPHHAPNPIISESLDVMPFLQKSASKVSSSVSLPTRSSLAVSASQEDIQPSMTPVSSTSSAVSSSSSVDSTSVLLSISGAAFTRCTNARLALRRVQDRYDDEARVDLNVKVPQSKVNGYIKSLRRYSSVGASFTPLVSKIYKTESVVDRKTGLKEFKIADKVGHFSKDSKGIWSSMFEGLARGLRQAKNRFKQTRLYEKWRDLDHKVMKVLKHEADYYLRPINSIHDLIKVRKPRNPNNDLTPYDANKVTVPSVLHPIARARAIQNNKDVDNQFHKDLEAYRRNMKLQPRLLQTDYDTPLNNAVSQFNNNFNKVSKRTIIDTQTAKSCVSSAQSSYDDDVATAHHSASIAEISYVMHHTKAGSFASSADSDKNYDAAKHLDTGNSAQSIAYGYLMKRKADSIARSNSIANSKQSSKINSMKSDINSEVQSTKASSMASNQSQSHYHGPYFD